MAKAQARIYKTTSPAGWFYTFDRLDVADGAIDNFATAATPGAALDAIKGLATALPGALSDFNININTLE